MTKEGVFQNRAGSPAPPDEVGYAGDRDPLSVWEALREERDSMLLDVRARAEWVFVGTPDLAALNKTPLFIEWRTFPKMEKNESFGEEALTALRDMPRDAPLFCICRSGQRSRDAARALTAMGFRRAYNVAEGFEGGADESGHRGTKTGWKAAGLPWRQS